MECFLCARYYAKYGSSPALSYSISIERSKYYKGKKKIHLQSGTNAHCYASARWLAGPGAKGVVWPWLSQGYAVVDRSVQLLRVWFSSLERNEKAAWVFKAMTGFWMSFEETFLIYSLFFNLLQLLSCPHNQVETKYFIFQIPTVLEFIIINHSVTLNKLIALCLGLLVWGLEMIKVLTT